jgi:hypothetical protein
MGSARFFRSMDCSVATFSFSKQLTFLHSPLFNLEIVNLGATTSRQFAPRLVSMLPAVYLATFG